MSQSNGHSHRFVLEMLDGETIVGRRELERPDFDRAIATVAFDAFRQGICPSYCAAPEGASVEPLWKEGDQTECTIGFRVDLPIEAGRPHGVDYGIGYFRPTACAFRGEIKRDKLMSTEQPLQYRLIAYPSESASARRSAIVLEPATIRTPIRASSVERFRECQPWDDPASDDLPVYIRRSVIDDLLSEASGAPEREVGGILLGHLHRDASSNEVFVEVTGIVSGGDTTIGDRASVTFTPETFELARRMIALRASDGVEEAIVGWGHSHPFRFCSGCPQPTPPECVGKVLFFSGADVLVMANAFDQPFMLGLLAGVEPKLEAALGHPPVRLFGWKTGEIVARGFHVIDG